MTNILFYDTEANSLDREQGFIQELAWAIFHKSGRLLSAKSRLIKWNRGYKVDDEAFTATGLSRDFCEEHGHDPIGVFGEFIIDSSHVDAICGHNIIEFDNKIMDSNIKRSMFESPGLYLPRALMIDTMHDLEYPSTIKGRSLDYLAMRHGLMMSGAHQALNDVLACAHVFFKYPVEKSFEIASTPFVTLHFYTDFHDHVGRELAYKLKFRWNRDFKRWDRSLRQYYVPQIAESLKGYQLYVNGLLHGQQEKPFNSMADQLSMLPADHVDERAAAIEMQKEHPEIPF